MSANACSPGWLRSPEHFLPSCADDAVSLPPLLLLSVKSSKTRVRGLPVVAYDDHKTDYRGNHRSDGPQLDFFFGSISVIFRRIRQTILLKVCWSTRAPKGWGFSVHVFLSHASSHPFSLHRHSCVPLFSGGSHWTGSLLVDFRVSDLPRFPGLTQFTQFSWTIFLRGRFRLRYVCAVVCLHIGPGPYFEVKLVFIFFLPFVNAPGEIHRGEMVIGPMALRESTSRCRVGHEALPLCPSSVPLFDVVCLLMCLLKCLVRRVAGTRHGRNQASSVRLLIDVVRVAWYGAPMARLVLYVGFLARVSVMYLGLGTQGRSSVSSNRGGFRTGVHPTHKLVRRSLVSHSTLADLVCPSGQQIVRRQSGTGNR